MAEVKLDIALFGAFRPFGASVAVYVPVGCGIAEVKQRLAAALGSADPKLIGASVLANDDEVLPASAVFDRDCRLAILPPVCGG